MFDRNLRILIASSEVAPFAKVGGLADVTGSLPKALATLGEGELANDVRVVMPRYRRVANAKYLTDFPLDMGRRQETAIIRESSLEARLGDAHALVPVYFVDNHHYFNRDGIYAYGDDAERFSFFCKAVLEMLPKLNFQPDVIHCNDWQTGPIPFLLKVKYTPLNPGFYQKIATVYTIHNLQYQGIFDKSALKLLGVGEEFFHPGALEFWGQVNFMKAGLLYADVLNTVSRTYAEEIQTPEYGERLEGVLQARSRDLFGIVNGLNYHEFNPRTDPRLVANYDKDYLGAKRENKTELQREMELPVRDVPVIGFVSRLVGQKGLDILGEAMDQLLTDDLQFIALGTGDPCYENLFRGLASRYPEKCSVQIGFNGVLAQRIYAGSDFFLMPSRFEPCGLGQLIAMRYGTIPIVRATGGLADTVHDFTQSPEAGNGFVFTEYSAAALLEAAHRALALYRERPELWTNLVRRVMEVDYSWSKSAASYVELYQRAISKVLAHEPLAV
ncbi:MAG: glycogen synthase [Bacillota bacterium]|nr:glycogen synthase [Bacillota bacterium]